MAKRRILAVNTFIPHDDVEYVPLDSDQSLLDADIVLFTPGLASTYSTESYQGRPLISQSGSPKSRDAITHWRSELATAMSGNKLIVIYLAKPQRVFAYTGEKQYSGTGRSRVATNIVESLDSYSMLPIPVGDVSPRSGNEIRVTKDIGILAVYWNEFGEGTNYECYLDEPFGKAVLVTRSGGKVIGSLGKTKGGATVAILPPLSVDMSEFYTEDADGDDVLNDAGRQFGNRYLSALVNLDNSAKSADATTPPPEWAQDSRFVLAPELPIRSEIGAVSSQIANLTARRAELNAKLEDAGRLRALLFETGKGLEAAVIQALIILGYDAKNYQEGDSEFDVVFESSEGRYLGEVEGTDTRAVNIDKLSQLERNILEDFEREDVSEYAAGVLFGNPFRLTHPESRGDAFTVKCMSGAKRGGVALVRTPDLFKVAQHLLSTNDSAFAAACRQAIANAKGEIVTFPSVPDVPSDSVSTG